jgi:uncharacterized glyoxalase superfamily protein PhnB
MTSFGRMKGCVPILPCANLDAMMTFYVDRLGFERRWVWGNPERPDRSATDGGVGSGEIQIFFMTDAALAGRSHDRELIIFTENVDAQYADHVARGAPVTGPPADEPWEMREYSVTDPHGNRLRFAEGLEFVRARRGS